jgi:hypothetical protein
MFNKYFSRFIVAELIITFIIAGVLLFLFKTNLSAHRFPLMPVALVVFLLVNTIVYGIQLKLLLTDRKKFSHFFLLGFLIKFFVYLAFFTIYILNFKAHITAFTLFFLLVYSIFTALEVVSIILVAKKNKVK